MSDTLTPPTDQGGPAMTITDLTHVRTRTRPARTEATPESQRLTELTEMLESGRYPGYADEIRAAIADEIRALTATTVLAA